MESFMPSNSLNEGGGVVLPPLLHLTLLPPEGGSPGSADLAKSALPWQGGATIELPPGGGATRSREGTWVDVDGTAFGRSTPQDEAAEVQLPRPHSPQRRRICRNPTVKRCAKRPSSSRIGA